MPNYEPIGLVSGAICAVSVLPQIRKSWISKSSKDISTSMIVLTYLAMGLGMIYGVLIRHAAIYLSNAVIFALYIVLHLVKLRNERISLVSVQEQELVEA
jgi:MtN3 and saliva related transmembrane protein